MGEETDFLASKKGTIYVCREDIKVAEEDKKTKWAAGDVTKIGGDPLGTEDFKPRPPRGEKRKRSQKKGKKGKKGQKGKKNKMKGAFKMNGATFVPMNMMQRQQPQMVMMNGQAYMVMPQQMGMGGMQMAGFGNMMNLQGGRKTKRRKKNRKNKNKKGGNSTTNPGGSW